jgi:hypothetical protein
MTAKHPEVLICEIQLTQVSFFKLRQLIRDKKLHARIDLHHLRSDYPGKPVLRLLSAQERKLWAYFHPKDEDSIQMGLRLRESPVDQPTSLEDLAASFPNAIAEGKLPNRSAIPFEGQPVVQS